MCERDEHPLNSYKISRKRLIICTDMKARDHIHNQTEMTYVTTCNKCAFFCNGIGASDYRDCWLRQM